MSSIRRLVVIVRYRCETNLTFPVNSPQDIPFSGMVTVDRSLDADTATYSGREYRVMFVDPYTRYGTGFVQAHCERMDFDGGAPIE